MRAAQAFEEHCLEEHSPGRQPFHAHSILAVAETHPTSMTIVESSSPSLDHRQASSAALTMHPWLATGDVIEDELRSLLADAFAARAASTEAELDWQDAGTWLLMMGWLPTQSDLRNGVRRKGLANTGPRLTRVAAPRDSHACSLALCCLMCCHEGLHS